MSEGTSAPSVGASAPAAASATQPQSTNTSNAQEKPQGQITAQAKDNQATGTADTGSVQKPAEEEVEEVKVGSLSAKVNKQFAKVIKDLERGFHAKAQEAARYRGEWDHLAQAAKENPEVADELLKRLGIDADNYSESRLAKRIEREMMSPEQKRIAELEQYKSQKDKEESERKEQEQAQQKEQEYQRASVEIKKQIASAIEKSPAIRDDAFLVAKVVAVKAQSEKQGLDWTWDDCVARVESDIKAALTGYASKLTPEQLEAMFGVDALSKWREHDLKRVTGKVSQTKPAEKSPGQAPVSTTPKMGKSLSESEYREYFQKLAQG